MPQPKRQLVMTGKIYRHETVRLDGRRFTDCHFDQCLLEYGGAGSVTLHGGTHFRECRWVFVGEAAATVEFRRAMAHVPGMAAPGTAGAATYHHRGSGGVARARHGD